jgi:replication-associated recombination protein RarA
LLREKEVGPGEPPQLSCDTSIKDWLQGNDHLDESLVGISRFYPPTTPLKNWPVDSNAVFLKRMLEGDSRNQVRLRVVGPPGSGRRTLSAIISSRVGLSLLAINTEQIAEHDWRRVFIGAQRQAYLDRCAIAWYGENVLRRAWPQVVPFFPVQFVICEAGHVPLPIPEVIDHLIEMPTPSLEERRELWRRFMPLSAAWPPEAFKKLAEQHRVNIGDIISAAQRDVQSVEEATSLIREATRHQLGNLAQLMECPFNWDDLVVTDNLREALDDLTFEASERVAFWERTEARRLFPQGRGLLGLFSGSPGTGKTMAAQVIAASLGLDLFRIDLSTVVSKYVGETSQNLERILSRAAGMDIVLLFDEADALFGKRTEIKDAHDRFANTDTGYLLQAIENYRGVALLATNKKGNIDPAFIRRIRYVLEFCKPDAKQREQIWRKIVGELAGSERLKALDRDLKTLAVDLELTGAQIKFTVLAAVFVAKRERKPLAMSHLLRGVDRELMKEGRTLSGRERERLLNG